MKRWSCTIAVIAAVGVGLSPENTWAQAAATGKKADPARASRSMPAASVPAASTMQLGPGWRVGPQPAWVVEPPAAPVAAPVTLASSAARHELLADLQSNHALPKAQRFVRLRTVATDPSTLGSVSQPQITFNPAFQTVVVHEMRVYRDGQPQDRLKDAKFELMRREQRLEQQVIDGAQTLLVVLNDVRVGEAVQVSYTVEGENPIYEGRISSGMQLAWDTPVAVMHQRIVAPAGRTLWARPIASDIQPERLVDGPNQVLRVLREQVAAVLSEQGTPPWVKVYPGLEVTEYADWSQVDQWAQRVFTPAVTTAPAIAERAAQFKASGLQGEALVAAVLRFVQDEVRYFSVSIGESSHRPKPAERTLAERVGDCKDKTVLLGALLTELGFDAKPALVSGYRNRALKTYLPSHDLFDHVIMRLRLNGNTYFLDATMTGQGDTLASRGYVPYGAALVVGDGADIVDVVPPSFAVDVMEFEQRWDVSKPGLPARLTVVLKAKGLAAERWRAGVATVGLARIAEAMAGAHTRVVPGLTAAGAAVVKDDRVVNVLEISQDFSHPDLGRYSRGAIELELAAVELLDSMNGPAESTRRLPWHLNGTRRAESRIVVRMPRPLELRSPLVSEINDRHFSFTARLESAGDEASFTRRFVLKADEVRPEHLSNFRENLIKARQATAGRLRMGLVDVATLTPEFQAIDRRLQSMRGQRKDVLFDILLRNEIDHLLAGKALGLVHASSPMESHMLAERAIAGNMLGRFEASLTDAERAAKVQPTPPDSLEAQGVALVGLVRLDDAATVFNGLRSGDRRTTADSWLGAIRYLQGRHGDAEQHFKDVIEHGGSESREFAILWLYLAAERQGGRGRAAIESHLAGSDAKKLTGVLLAHLAGQASQDDVLQIARAKPEMERLNLAEAHFFIGQRHLAQGRRDEAKRAFERAVDTGAVPQREVTFSQIELTRLLAR